MEDGWLSHFQAVKKELVARFLLGGLFLVAGALKVGDIPALQEAISNYRLLPSQWIGVAAVFLPWLELVPATTLLLGLWKESSALLLGVLSLLFGCAVTSVLWRHLDVRCGCFKGAASVSYLHLLLDVSLVVMAATVARGSECERANSLKGLSGNERKQVG